MRKKVANWQKQNLFVNSILKTMRKKYYVSQQSNKCNNLLPGRGSNRTLLKGCFWSLKLDKKQWKWTGNRTWWNFNQEQVNKK